jgi:hypothetical protein
MMKTERTTVEYDNGDTLHYVNGLLHSRSQPAVKTSEGYEIWFCNGRLHRSDGPAYIGPGGIKEYWLGGERISESAYIEMLASWIKDFHRQFDLISEAKSQITNALFEEISKTERYRQRAFAIRKRSLFWHKIAGGMGEMNAKMMKRQTAKKMDRFPIATNTCVKCAVAVKMQAIYVGRQGPYCSDRCSRE